MELIKYLLISAPMISAFTCGIIFMVAFHKSLFEQENKIRKVLGGYYCIMVVLWLLAIVSIENYAEQLSLIPIFLLLLHIIQVSFYHFVTYIIPVKKKFDFVHYVMAGVVFIMTSILVLLLIVTGESKQMNLTFFFGEYVYVYASLCILIYTVLCWIQLYRYKKTYIEQNNKPLNTNWIHLLLVVRTVFALSIIVNNYDITWLNVFSISLIPVQHIILTYNVLKNNIVDRGREEYKTNIMLQSGDIVSINDSGLMRKAVSRGYSMVQTDKHTLLTQEDFEAYFSKEKPYLKKDFKLDDLVLHFRLNRTYISKFVNVTFQTNVSQFINQWRLKEVEELKQKGLEINIEYLVLRAGFSNYRHYLRAKKKSEVSK